MNTSFAKKPTWLVDGVGTSSVVYNFSAYAIGASIDSATHNLKISNGKDINSVKLSLPNCKIGNITISVSKVNLLINGTAYLDAQYIKVRDLTASQGATTAIRFLNTSQNVSGAVSCSGGNLTLSY